MALMERVTTLIRANLNDLLDKAEDPEKMLRQLVLDMQNQLLQVKTQVAIALADQHLLTNKRKESEEKAAEWMRKAELALDKKDEVLAREALERSVGYRSMASSLQQQGEDQAIQVENLKSALRNLERKLTETQAASELLIVQNRRARVANRAADLTTALPDSPGTGLILDRMKNKVARTQALGQAKTELAGENVEDRLLALEREDEVGKLLAELKSKRDGTN